MIQGGGIIPIERLEPDSETEHEQPQREGHEQGPQSRTQEQGQVNTHREDARAGRQRRGFDFHDLFVQWLLDRNIDIYSR